MTATKFVQLRITPALHAQLLQLAARENNPLTTVARRLLVSALEREQRQLEESR